MASRRATKTPRSKKCEGGPIELQFFHETGVEYRPFIDPGRIAANDAKKSSAHDMRAYVNGVPQEYLGVMTTGEKEHASKRVAREHQNNAPALDPGSFEDIDKAPYPALSVDGFATQAMDQNDHYVPEQITTKWSHVTMMPPSLRVSIPEDTALSSYQDPHQSTSAVSPAPSCPSAIHQTPTSACQRPFTDLTLPCALSNQMGRDYEERDAETLFPAFEQMFNAGFESLTGEPGSDYSFSTGSPESSLDSASPESDMSITSPYTPTPELHNEGHISFVAQPFDDCPGAPAQPAFDQQISDDSFRQLSPQISYAHGYDIDYFVSELSQNMQLNSEDLRYVDEAIKRDHRISPHGDPHVFMASYDEGIIMSEPI